MKVYRILVFIGAILLLLTLVACGPATAPAQRGTSGGVAPAPTMAPAPAAPPMTAAGEQVSVATTDVSERLIIKTATMSLIITDTQEAIGTVTAMATGAGGFVLNTSTHHEDDQLLATMVIKVPVEKFEDTLADLRQMAFKVDAESTSGQDVTAEYTDLDAQLRNLKATEEQLLTFLDKTQNVDEALKVYRELSNIRGQIEQIQGRMNYLSKSAAMSTITVNLRPKAKEAPIVKAGWQPLETLKSALRALVSVGQGLINLGIWLLIFSPVWGILLLIVWWLRQRLRRRPKPAPQMSKEA
jgi:hypothetical protein